MASDPTVVYEREINLLLDGDYAVVERGGQTLRILWSSTGIWSYDGTNVWRPSGTVGIGGTDYSAAQFSWDTPKTAITATDNSSNSLTLDLARSDDATKRDVFPSDLWGFEYRMDSSGVVPTLRFGKSGTNSLSVLPGILGGHESIDSRFGFVLNYIPGITISSTLQQYWPGGGLTVIPGATVAAGNAATDHRQGPWGISGRTTDLSLTSNTWTDVGISLPGCNATGYEWFFHVFILWEAHASYDIRFRWQVSSGTAPTMQFQYDYGTIGGTAPWAYTQVMNMTGAGLGNLRYTTLCGRCVPQTNSNPVKLQASQIVTNAGNPSVVHAGTMIRYWYNTI